jgi:hypothetical protein
MITGVATSAFAIKRAIFGKNGRLKAEANGGMLSGWSVDYSFNAGAGAQSIYGGGWRLLEQQDDVAEGLGLLLREVIEVSLYISVKISPRVDVEETDAVVETVSGLIVQAFKAKPELASQMMWLGISRGQGDYVDNNLETISRAAFALRVQTELSWEPQP